MTTSLLVLSRAQIEKSFLGCVASTHDLTSEHFNFEYHYQLSSTKDLLGRSGIDFLLLGMLAYDQAGNLCLEDLDGRVVLDLSNGVRLFVLLVLVPDLLLSPTRVKASSRKDVSRWLKEHTRTKRRSWLTH